MLHERLSKLGITDPRVLEAIRRVPREEFVPPFLRNQAQENRPLPIGYDQTISQPLVVAEMMELAQLKPGSTALDIGTGSGYQAALLAELVGRVHTIETVEPLYQSARKRLEGLGYQNIEFHLGDGSLGLTEHAPYHAILAAAAPVDIPQPLIDQLTVGGRLVIPVGPANKQHLAVIEKQEDGSVREQLVAPVAFVPMVSSREDRPPSTE